MDALLHEEMWQLERDFLDGKISSETYNLKRLIRAMDAPARARKAREIREVFFQKLAELIYKVKLEPMGW